MSSRCRNTGIESANSSKPFCAVSRDTTPNTGARGSCGSWKRCSIAAFIFALPDRSWAEKWCGMRGSAAGFHSP